jgi:hypothetical protein
MRKTLEDLYYGNITPSEQRMIPDSEMAKAVARVASCEKQLMEQLGCHPANKNSKRKRNKIAGEEEKRVPQKRDGR